jgi:hypothetical protein
MSWNLEFPKFTAMPQVIIAALANGTLDDISWGNDSCPSFIRRKDTDVIDVEGAGSVPVLYVDWESTDDRETTGEKRFIVVSKGTVQSKSTDDADEALRWLMEEPAVELPTKEEPKPSEDSRIDLVTPHQHAIDTVDQLRAAHQVAVRENNGYAVFVLLKFIEQAVKLERDLNELRANLDHKPEPVEDPEKKFADWVIEELEKRGIMRAYWEFPGYISVHLDKRGDFARLACGTANTVWECNLWTEGTGETDAGTPPAPKNATVKQVADLIEDAYYRHNLTPPPKLSPEEMTALIKKVADEFDVQIRTALGDADYQQAIIDNNALSPERFELICHTQDYCDANEVMAAAIEHVLQRAVETNNEWDTALWNAAWKRWKQDRKGGVA